MECKELKITAENQRLEEVLQFINEELEQKGFTMKQVMQVDIAVEEIFCNIANYAYHPETGTVMIYFCYQEDPADQVMIEFIDSGSPYNPLAKEDPDISLQAEERQIGGLGIFMTKKMMDSMEYRYEDGKNILMITKQKKD